jgi:hypothetical protein
MIPAPRFPESTARRPDFDPDGPRVRLADGQEWTFPRVKLTSRLRVDDPASGATSLARVASTRSDRLNGPVYTKYLEEWLSGDGDAYHKTLRLAWLLLSLNYDLPADAAGELLAFDEPEDPAVAPPLIAVLVPVLQGRRPKSGSATGSPTA